MPIQVHTAEMSSASPPGRRPRARTRHSDLLVEVTGQVIDSIRQVIFSCGPTPPRAVIAHPPQLEIEGLAGRTARTSLTVRNCQSAVVVVSPALSVLRGADGSEWSPAHTVDVAQRLLWPGDLTVVEITVAIAADAPRGRFEGELRCFGIDGPIPLLAVIRGGAQP